MDDQEHFTSPNQVLLHIISVETPNCILYRNDIVAVGMIIVYRVRNKEVFEVE